MGTAWPVLTPMNSQPTALKFEFLVALDRNVRILSPIEMSVYRREAICGEELVVCPESESSRRDELLSGHAARCGGVVQTSYLPTIRDL